MTFLRAVEVDEAVGLAGVSFIVGVYGADRGLDLVPYFENYLVGSGAGLVEFVFEFLDGLEDVAVRVVVGLEYFEFGAHYGN